jgi:hypothetical protein
VVSHLAGVQLDLDDLAPTGGRLEERFVGIGRTVLPAFSDSFAICARAGRRFIA